MVLSTNVLFGVQSVYKKEKGLTGMYYDYAMAAPYMAGLKEKDSLDILILGMGVEQLVFVSHVQQMRAVLAGQSRARMR